MTNEKEDNFQIIETHAAYTGWTKLLVATIKLPDGRRIKREIEDHGEAICVMPYHPVRKTAILVRQPRIPVLFSANQQKTLEAIAGIIEEKDPRDCVYREVMEEALLKLDSVEHLFTGWTMPGISTERMHFYLATYSGEPRPETKGGADEDESTVAVEISLAELARMLDCNELIDVKTILLLQTLRLRKPELF
jgi:nudix-type nucleoside diphosphatase (YffH/AdpP family)